MWSAFVLWKELPQFLFTMYEGICRACWQADGSKLEWLSKKHCETYFWEFSYSSRDVAETFQEKRAAVLMNYSRGGSCMFRRVNRAQTFIQSQKKVQTLLWMACGQQRCDFLGRKPAGSASASSWYMWCLVNVSTWWGVTGTEWAVQSLMANIFKPRYCFTVH